MVCLFLGNIDEEPIGFGPKAIASLDGADHRAAEELILPASVPVAEAVPQDDLVERLRPNPGQQWLGKRRVARVMRAKAKASRTTGVRPRETSIQGLSVRTVSCAETRFASGTAG